MALDAEEELRCLWQQWFADAKSHQDQATSQWCDNFYVDERNQAGPSDFGGRNSVMDAEALLCFLQPQGSLDAFRLRSGCKATGIGVDSINRHYSASGGDGRKLDLDAISMIVELSTNFLEENRAGEIPVFSARSYLDPTDECPSELQDTSIAIVDSYTMSASACLHLLYLLGPSGWGNRENTNSTIAGKCADAYKLADERLSYALHGLCQSFAYSEKSEGTWEKATMIKWPVDSRVIEGIRQRLGVLSIETNASLAFECGWSWGPIAAERKIPTTESRELGIAIASPDPYLYFTLNAMDGIEDLFEEWVQTEEILKPEQLALTARLRNLSDLTGRYWAAIAFSNSLAQDGRWALEALPWRTTDKDASLQWSLYVYGLALREHLAGRQATTPSELSRLISLLEELAERGRLTRAPVDNLVPKEVSGKLEQSYLKIAQRDPALSLHWPGLELSLEDNEKRSIYTMPIYDYAPQLLKRAAILLRNTTDLDLRDRLRTLIDRVWDEHLKLRANKAAKATPKYWDFPAEAYSAFRRYESAVISAGKSGEIIEDSRKVTQRVASWYVTQRVTEALVALSHAIGKRQRLRLTTVEIYIRELSDHLVNEIDELISESGPEDREHLESLRTTANNVRTEFDKGNLTECLRMLDTLIDETKKE